jgi:hypothetical protein
MHRRLDGPAVEGSDGEERKESDEEKEELAAGADRRS